MATGVLSYRGSAMFRMRLVTATLTGKSVLIEDIRVDEQEIGLRDYEAGLLRLLEKVSNGCRVEINETGTSVLYTPGVLTGGKFSHDCALSRGIGYYAEALFVLGPFCKKPISAVLRGVTNESLDTSVDVLRMVVVPVLRTFGLEADAFVLKINKRGAPPGGGGEIKLTIPTAKALSPVLKVAGGEIRRIRGVAYTTRLSPLFASRMVDAAKSVLVDYMADVFIYTDHYKGSGGGASPGFAISLVAESETGALLPAELTASKGDMPEAIGEAAALLLLEEVARGGAIATVMQPLVLMYMAFSSEDVSAVRFGTLSKYAISVLRLIRDFVGVVFKIEADRTTETVLLSCMGSGHANTARVVQ
ncbi:18S rRNA biogenesis protein RCL1 [Thecamonas trahens ATCC 50062]|uniref:18S rRNA biogenesis protein RCL1 n=1 Tax=Thecamonas trahens ATCC 50062 TaxID=461836 RepID=A0A0L0DRI8_THETB|nr:18S rRNA biogenesis protein RCL1 [Thecamonas trahens ATCC 50062]KNC54939.1 18S rRNA biogenesis protein RCL1 [Thecamonas trahens ATCC 50062]|eukprot:XP_013753389.1 18S rRNA biogenesis protein RCL1 [Thecamonas trahens ATCC 50062]